HAIEIAAQMLADKGGGRLLVVHAHPRDTEHSLKIVDPERDVPSLELDFAYVREARQQLAEDLAGIAAPPGVSIEGRLLVSVQAPEKLDRFDHFGERDRQVFAGMIE